MGGKRGTIEERLCRRIIEDDEGCWLWCGATNEAGYGLVSAEGRSRLAHRVAYQVWVGPIPTGLTLDHLCRVRRCVNPAHLEPVTRGENLRRGERATFVAWRNGTCTKGHDASEFCRRANGKVVYCKACRRERRAAAASSELGVR